MRPRPSNVPMGIDIPEELRAFLDDLDRKIPLSKLDATAAPAITDDGDAGYSIGSRWYDLTADDEYVCLDNTQGTAVWKLTT